MPPRLPFALWLLPLSTLAQSTKPVCNCGALIDPAYKGVVTVYAQPQGRVVARLRQDEATEDLLVLVIKREQAGYFYVSIGRAISGQSWSGWIAKAPYVGTFTRNYDRPLRLYAQAQTGAKVLYQTKGWDNALFPIVRCQGTWAYVRQQLPKGKTAEGWLSPADQCDNPYTTCN